MTDGTFFVVTRIVGTVLLLASFGCFAYGGLRIADELWFLATSVPAKGEIVHVREKYSTQRDDDTHRSYGSP